jgi:hypothetical protein
MNEHLPLKTLNFPNGTFLILQRGTLPKKDLLIIEFNEYFPPNFTFSQALENLHKRNMKNESLHIMEPLRPMQGIFTIPVMKTCTLLDLKQMLLSQDYFIERGITESSKLRLRLLHKKAVLGKLIPVDSKPIGNKSQGLTKDCAVAVTVVVEDEKDLSQHSMILRVVVARPNQCVDIEDFKKLNPKDVADQEQLQLIETLITEPEIPFEMVFDGGESPSYKDLHSALLKLSKDFDLKFSIFKWIWGEKTWKIILDGPSLVEEVEEKNLPKKKGSAKTAAKNLGLRGKPFELKDGGKIGVPF